MKWSFDVRCSMFPPSPRGLWRTGNVRRSRANARSAFTLVELLVVIAIMGVLMGLVMGVTGYAIRKADNARAASMLEQIKNGLEEYRIEFGRYPVNENDGENRSKAISKALWVDPQDAGFAPFLVLEGWNDEDEEYQILDPWGNEYHYIHRANSPYATHNNSKFGYDLWSTGIDLQNDDDDITNWRDAR